MSGVLSDFKESERLPGELAAIIATMADELESACRTRKTPAACMLFNDTYRLTADIHEWFYKKRKTKDLMNSLQSFFFQLAELDGAIAPNYIVRLKQEQSNLRKLLLRIHTIRETNFISSGYLVGTTTSSLLLLGLVFLKIDPFYESLFGVGIVAYLVVFVMRLIQDLDNPFGYYERSSSEDVSLKPIEDLLRDLGDRAASEHFLCHAVAETKCD